MATSTQYVKRSVTIPRAVLREAEPFVARGGFSAYVSEALRDRIARDKLTELIDELEAVHGPAAPSEVAEWAERLG
jgi:hypothetical protein